MGCHSHVIIRVRSCEATGNSSRAAEITLSVLPVESDNMRGRCTTMVDKHCSRRPSCTWYKFVAWLEEGSRIAGCLARKFSIEVQATSTKALGDQTWWKYF